MTMNKYIGSRYVPLYIGVHDKTKTYEPLSIVSNDAKTETYTSKQAVPEGIELDNETYWVQSGWSNPDMQIKTATEFVDAGTDSDLSIKSTTNGYKLTLSDSNAFYCAGSMDTAQTLNTMLDSGRYIIKPSICTEVPSDIETSENPAQLVIADYDADRTMQILTAYNDDSAMMFVRTCDGATWTDWKETSGSGGGGSYTLPVASATKLGGVKIGNTIEISSDGTIDVAGGSGYVLPVASKTTLGGVKIGKNVEIATDGTISVSNGASGYTAGDGIKISNDTISLVTFDRTPDMKVAGVEWSSFYNGLIFYLGDGLEIFNTGTYDSLTLSPASKTSIGGIRVSDDFDIDSQTGELKISDNYEEWAVGTGTCPYGTVTYKQCGKNVHCTFTIGEDVVKDISDGTVWNVNIDDIPNSVVNYDAFISFNGTMSVTNPFVFGVAGVGINGGVTNMRFTFLSGTEAHTFTEGDTFDFDYLAA